jgi:hypothetical protein
MSEQETRETIRRSAPGTREEDPGPASYAAVVGVALLFAFAVFRLGRQGLEAIRSGLTPLEWGLLLILTGLFVWGEGVRALSRKWVPRVVDRAAALPRRSLLLRLLGPLHAMGLVGGTRRGMIRAWLGTAAVVVAVVAVRALPSPWRGIVDFAVAAALAWGIVALAREVRRWRA